MLKEGVFAVYVNQMIDSLVENIRTTCKEKHVSITQMESDLGFSSGLISRWSKTKTSPSFDKIVAIMRYLDVSYDELMGDISQNEPISLFKTQTKKEELCHKILADSKSGSLEWTDVCDDMPFRISFEQVFPDWSDYHVHRIYHTANGGGFYFLALQYNERKPEINVALYILAEDGADPTLLAGRDDVNVKEILKLVDGASYMKYIKQKEDKMMSDYLVS